MMSSCLDFWITKNITGRYLIGLRWWSASDLLEEDFENPPSPVKKPEKELKKVNKEGKEEEDSGSEEGESSSEEVDFEEAPLIEEWYFESYDNKIPMSSVDSYIFWWSQTSITVFWMIFVIIKALSLSIFWVK